MRRVHCRPLRPGGVLLDGGGDVQEEESGEQDRRRVVDALAQFDRRGAMTDSH